MRMMSCGKWAPLQLIALVALPLCVLDHLRGRSYPKGVPNENLRQNHLGQTRTSADFATHLANVVQQLPAMQRYDWVVDHLHTHWSLEVCRLVAQWCKVPCVAKDLRRGVQRRAFLSDPTHQHVFHFPPKHGSWLNQVALWLSVLARRFLKRGDCDSAQDFTTRL